MIFITLMIGIVAGLRALTPLAALSWAASLSILKLDGTWLAFMGYRWSPWVFSVLALGELINDKMPQTPSRKVPIQFATRILTGTFAGFMVGTPHEIGPACALSAAVGAVLGTLAGASMRERMVRLIGGRDFPVAVFEDCIAVGTSAWIVSFIL